MQDRVLTLRKGRMGHLRPGHPWIYKGQFRHADSSMVKPGELVSVKDSVGRFIGTGYYNPRSEIAVRILSFGDVGVDEKFFRDKIRTAVEKRKGLFAKTSAYRAVFSEADGLPGLIVDIYDETAVFQVLTLGMEKLKEFIVKAIKEVMAPEYVYEKSISPFRKTEGLKNEQGWRGVPGKTTIEIFEGKARFLVDIEKGHKTGFYLDQRRSRMGLEGFVKNKKVLDLFCYTGAFSISAAIFGASRIKGVDVKGEWLKLGGENARLNGVSDKVEFIEKDAFSTLKEITSSKERFDVIIIDPPSFLRTRESMASASKGYKKLNLEAMGILNKAGILATFSCSHNMPNEAFSKILKEAASEAGRRITILKRCHQAEDHPVARAIPETEYLKGYFLQVNSD